MSEEESISGNDEIIIISGPEPESLETPAPVTLPPATTEFNVVFNGKQYSTLEKSNIDVNQSFEGFLTCVIDVVVKKTKQSHVTIEESTLTLRWIWMTAAKSQQKQLPRYSDLDNEFHWEHVQRTIQMAARKNKFLDNVL